jgi:hypothetical protein
MAATVVIERCANSGALTNYLSAHEMSAQDFKQAAAASVRRLGFFFTQFFHRAADELHLLVNIAAGFANHKVQSQPCTFCGR